MFCYLFCLEYLNEISVIWCVDHFMFEHYSSTVVSTLPTIFKVDMIQHFEDSGQCFNYNKQSEIEAWSSGESCEMKTDLEINSIHTASRNSIALKKCATWPSDQKRNLMFWGKRGGLRGKRKTESVRQRSEELTLSSASNHQSSVLLGLLLIGTITKITIEKCILYL